MDRINPMEMWGIIFGSIGAVTAVIGLITAILANQKSKTANDIAAEALREASKANQIAEQANHLSGEANSLVKAQSEYGLEKWFVQWSVEWDSKLVLFTLKNNGSDKAINPTVTLSNDRIYKFWDGWDKVSPGDAVVLLFEEFQELRSKVSAKETGLWLSKRSSAKLTVIWFTGLGQPRQQVIDVVID